MRNAEAADRRNPGRCQQKALACGLAKRDGIAGAHPDDRPGGRHEGLSAFENQRKRIGALLQRPMRRFGGDRDAFLMETASCALCRLSLNLCAGPGVTDVCVE